MNGDAIVQQWHFFFFFYSHIEIVCTVHWTKIDDMGKYMVKVSDPTTEV